jgi:hypothetical protein
VFIPVFVFEFWAVGINKWAPLKITVRHSDESQNLIRTMVLWEIAGQARNDIRTMDVWAIAGMLNLIRYRNDDTSFLEAP